jgi:inorganic pyrophosphatase
MTETEKKTYHVRIEIPYMSNVKYEYEDGELVVDRILTTAMFYPGNYGYIENTLSEDTDPIDVLVINDTQILPMSSIECKIIGVLETSDESGNDPKIVALPCEKVDPKYDHIHDIGDVRPAQKETIRNFFENYKKLEKGKSVIVGNFKDRKEALKLIVESQERRQQQQQQ